MSSRTIVGVLVTALALTLASSATTSSTRVAGTLALDATVRPFYRFDPSFCPAGVQAPDGCVRFVGEEAIPGLGVVTTTYTKILPSADVACPVIQHNTAVVAVAGKGSLELSRPGKLCGPTAPASVGPLDYTVTAGTGIYAGASGMLTFRSSVYSADLGCGPCGTSQDIWTGTVVVPGLEFDLVAPVIAGATAKTVKAPKPAKRMRVRYAVTARDVVDGAVRVACQPPSGTFFKRGRTVVKCSATDSSANTSNARFVVTVK